MVSIEYEVSADQEADFLSAMIVRRSRLPAAPRAGACTGSENADLFLEQFHVPTWGEHQRQHDGRLTAEDRAIEDAAFAPHRRDPTRPTPAPQQLPAHLCPLMLTSEKRLNKGVDRDDEPIDHAHVENVMALEDTRSYASCTRDSSRSTSSRCGPSSTTSCPLTPAPKAVPRCGSGGTSIRSRSDPGDLVPVGRGGERRALGPRQPGLGGRAYVSPTLWAAIQYLGPKEAAPEHRHSQNAFRFVVEGEECGLWSTGIRCGCRGATFCSRRAGTSTVTTTRPTIRWPGSTVLTSRSPTPTTSASLSSAPSGSRTTPRRTSPAPSDCGATRAYAHYQACRTPVSSPIGAYRWEYTDGALTDQLLLEDEGQPATVEQGHAAVRYVNPTTGGDDRCRRSGPSSIVYAPDTTTPTRREVGSTVFQVFDGGGSVVLDGTEHQLDKGDLFVVPSWVAWSLQAETQFDLFRFSDAPIMEHLHFDRVHVERETR